nr:DUF5348 domain-containing protein [Terrihalobacillus insolitus]
MKYNEELDSWVVIQESQEMGLYCGESFDLYLEDGKSIPCRIELSNQWYLLLGRYGVKFNLEPKEVYKINI